MDLIAYDTNVAKPCMRVAPVERDWMDRSPGRFAYKCLPLIIANSYGWQVCNPVGFSATWTGEDDAAAISIVADGPASIATSHFGSGIITLKLPYLFRTDDGTDLLVQGPTNMPKDGISPLTALVEADWGPFSFTMNWMFTRPNSMVRFDAGEPICQLWPTRARDLEAVQPVYRSLRDNPALKRDFKNWARTRAGAIEKEASAADTAAPKWERKYFVGPLGSTRHRTKLKLREFRIDRPKPLPDQRDASSDQGG